MKAAALALAGSFLIGACGGGQHHQAEPEPEPADAQRTVDAFLYAPPTPAKVCPRLWVASAQSACAEALRRLERARARHLFAPPGRGTIVYRLAGVRGQYGADRGGR